MPVLTYSQADIDTLKAAIVSGVKKVSYAGPPRREVEYQDIGAMREALASMVASLNGTPSFRLATHRKGFS